MKKMKGVFAAMESSRSLSAPAYEDARTRFKHQSLLQDFEDLYKETEAERKKLQMMRQKRLTLLAEVRFLRRRHKYLSEHQAEKPLVKPNMVQPQKLLTGITSGRKDRNHKQKDVLLREPVPRFDSNQKGKIRNEREVVLGNPVLISKLKQKQKPNGRNKAGLRDLLLIPDLNQKEKICGGKEASVRNNIPIFDLNEISREEEELQASDEVVRIEEPKISLMRSGNDEQHNEMRLLACRNIGNGSAQGGKRKISWQDPMALRV